MKKCAFIYNPESGKTNSKKDIDKIVELLEINGYDTLLCPTEYKGHAIKIVEELEDVDLLISCGNYKVWIREKERLPLMSRWLVTRTPANGM